MYFNKEIYNKAKDRLEQRRLSALDMVDFRKKEVYSKDKRFEEIDQELGTLGAKTAIAVLKGSKAAEELISLKEKCDSLNKEYNSLLEKYGYSETYLEPKYSCPKCNDTGMVEENNKTTICECMVELINEENSKSLNEISPLQLSTFESFSLDYYENQVIDGKNALDRMSKIYNYCRKYADEFSSKSNNLFMQGGTGLGKTHLSLAIANDLIKKGHNVVYVCAPDILSKLQREHFDYNYKSESDTMNTLMNCDLLIIDDLGTEFTSPFSISTIYNIFNSRIQMGKPIIINTNLQLSEIEQIYSQRMVSRLIGHCDRLEFIGQDIRSLK